MDDERTIKIEALMFQFSYMNWNRGSQQHARRVAEYIIGLEERIERLEARIRDAEYAIIHLQGGD